MVSVVMLFGILSAGCGMAWLAHSPRIWWAGIGVLLLIVAITGCLMLFHVPLFI